MTSPYECLDQPPDADCPVEAVETRPGSPYEDINRARAAGFGWYDEVAGPDHGVHGYLLVHPWFYSPQLNNYRRLYVYLPVAYLYSSRPNPYPVIYMHDGQNLFDPNTSALSHQDWQVDEAIRSLFHEDIEPLIVGIESIHQERTAELSPGGSKSRQYLAFLVDTVRPMIQHCFYVSRVRDNTGVMGASLGGLISLEAYFFYPQVFGFVGCMSPPSQYAEQHVRRYRFNPGRIYLDDGAHEPSCSAEPFYRLLCQMGYRPGDRIRYVHDPVGEHDENSWARRFPDAVRFLMPRWAIGFQRYARDVVDLPRPDDQ